MALIVARSRAPASRRQLPDCLRRLCAVGALVACAACSSSSADDLTWRARTVASLARSASMVLTAWLKGAAPTAYARRSVKGMADQVASIASDVAQAKTDHIALRTQLVPPIGRIGSALAASDAALDARDPVRIQTAQTELDAADSALRNVISASRS